ncbi:hypothetical protein TEPIDINF_001738 [Tepidibacillus infernus]|uniref:Uncharacterized protein n=1 Tax=Tepidibacillus decaturensis TaxID=1413211 RepID=A0A135L5H3_9BACI|nr:MULTISPECIES: hypothetical protein [Tepidibacillus]KXG44226.1 hypothetical protein U473_09590 [Tepidibacillus decaturensis]GBF10240.1 hypothetical protein HK1_00252 [Tepidibacillus sp. HK-1]
MFQVQINKEYINSLYFDKLNMGKNQFITQSDQYVGLLSNDEFESFMRENNLITYKEQLKLYESGEVVGNFYKKD